MADVGSASASDGIAFLVSAGIVAEIIAKACSSPQTMHINAHTRAATLMLWVNIGVVEAAVFVAIAAAIDSKHRKAIIAGGLVEAAITYTEYVYAKRAGLNSAESGTEAPAAAPAPWSRFG
jgi:hypothetical protein